MLIYMVNRLKTVTNGKVWWKLDSAETHHLRKTKTMKSDKKAAFAALDKVENLIVGTDTTI